MREIQECEESTLLEARGETYGPATRAAQLSKLQTALEQRSKRVVKHFEVCKCSNEWRTEACIHAQRKQFQ